MRGEKFKGLIEEAHVQAPSQLKMLKSAPLPENHKAEGIFKKERNPSVFTEITVLPRHKTHLCAITQNNIKSHQTCYVHK